MLEHSRQLGKRYCGCNSSSEKHAQQKFSNHGNPERTRKQKPRNESTIPCEISQFEFWSSNYAKNNFNISIDGCIKDEVKKRTLLLQQAPFAQKILRRVLPEGYDLEKADRESVIKIQNCTMAWTRRKTKSSMPRRWLRLMQISAEIVLQ